MYSKPILLIITYLLIGCGSDKSQMESGEKVNNVHSKEENFESFLKKFSSDKDFQFSRIQFPVNNKVYNTDTGQFENLFIPKADWTFSNFNNKLYSKKVTEENAKKFILNIQIDDTGVHIDYIFELINGEWFLTAIIDEST